VVNGRYSDIDGVWIAPVRAAVMITLDMVMPLSTVIRSIPLSSIRSPQW
jgi:hypothetical protein